MPIGINSLKEYINQLLIVQIDVRAETDGEEDFREVEGKLLAVNASGIVLKTMGATGRIIPLELIIDIDVPDRPTVKRLIKRWRRVITSEDVRQHLIDHHAKKIDQVAMLTPDEALAMHEKIDHELLGHGHGVKPLRRQRRKVHTMDAEEAVEIDYDDEDDDDNDEPAGESDVVSPAPIEIAIPAQPAQNPVATDEFVVQF